MKFMGYRRKDGKVGIRNHVIVMAGTLCSDIAARKVADKVPGAVYLHNPKGCAQTPQDTAVSLAIMSGLVANPNVYGAVIIGLGCETLQEARYREAIASKADKPVRYIKMQDHGLKESVRIGAEMAEELLAEAARVQREECDVSELIVSLECGGSDPTSGFSANNVVGWVSDKIVELGGTTILAETPEALGAEHILRDRGRTPEVGQKIYDAVKNNEKFFADLGINVRDSNPSPGNKASGITTLEEKSLGCVHKAGHAPFEAVYGYGEMIDKKGLVFYDATAFDIASVAAKVAGGAQVTIFTTGMGNPIGCACGPVIKVTGNHKTATVMDDIIDFDTSASITGEKTLEELGQEMFDLLIAVCEGKTVKAEENGCLEMAINQFYSYA